MRDDLPSWTRTPGRAAGIDVLREFERVPSAALVDRLYALNSGL
jgi:hypothetical protein